MQISAIVCAGVVLIGTTSAYAGETAEPEPAQVSQAMLDAVREVSGVPGLSAAIWRDGSVVWTGTTGMRDLEKGLPVNRATRFRLASVSKLVTVAAVGRLAEEGRIDLDAPVTAILPWLETNWAAITARQLAAHTSGLPHYQAVDEDRGTAVYPDGRSAVAIFSGRKLLSAPGAEYSYSSWGYTLLGALVEEVTGQPFAEYVGSAIVPGLDIGIDATDTGKPDVSRAYEFIEGRARPAAPHNYSYTWGGGGLMASAEAIVRFGGAMIENRIVSAQTFDSMARPYELASGEPAGEQGFLVGFGWRSMPDGDGQPTLFHNGSAIGARSSLVLWREQRMAVALLSNVSWTSSIDATGQMLAAPFRQSPAGLVAAACPTQARRFAGMLDDRTIEGWARFISVGGICLGELELSGELRAYFDRGPQATAASLRIVGLDQSGGLSRAGLVTPFGIYDLRSTADGGFRSALSPTRTVAFRLEGSGLDGRR